MPGLPEIPPIPYRGAVVGHWWCPVCDTPVHRTHRPGRPKVYCSNACRQKVYRWRCRHGVRLFVTEQAPAERALSRDKRHALRHHRDFMAGMHDLRQREIAVCGAFVRPARYAHYTHYDFLPDHPWSCRSCVRLVGSSP